jgi:hypothetical protein
MAITNTPSFSNQAQDKDTTMKTNNYDLNIYVLDGTVMLIPYRATRDSEGLLRIDYQELPSLRLDLYMNRPEHNDAITWALGIDSWDDPRHFHSGGFLKTPAEYWNEHDLWMTTDMLKDGTIDDRIPAPLNAWFKNLPAYWLADGMVNA